MIAANRRGRNRTELPLAYQASALTTRCYTPKSPREDLNLQLPAYEAGTLPVELHGRHGRMGSERFELSTHGLRVRYVTSYATSPENMERVQKT